MIYMFLIGIILLVLLIFLIINKLGSILDLMTLWRTKAISFKDELNEIHQSIDSINSKLAPLTVKKSIIFFEEKKQDKSYMSIMYGYIEQTKIFNLRQILYGAEILPSKNLVEHIKKHYLLMLAHMMHENNLQFSDFKIQSTYGGNGPNEHFYIPFKLRNMKYYGWDEWISKAILSVEMTNGEVKEFVVKSYINDLEQYFEIEDESIKIHFFDALTKVYPNFVFDTETYRAISGYPQGDYIVVLNDLIHLYNRVGKEWNVIFADSFSTVFDNEWTGKLEDLWNKTRVIDPLWSIREPIVQIVSQDDLKESRKKLFESIKASQNEDDQFVLASMYYYNQINYDDFGEMNQNEAIDIWHKLANKNHAFAHLVLGIIYYDGLYVLKDFQKSKVYVQKAFENGLEKPALKVWNDLKLYEY